MPDPRDAPGAGQAEPVRRSPDGGHYSLRNIRRSAGHFLLGKAGSAALTFTAFALTARLLGTGAYGTYAALIAAVELGLSLSTLGMDWATGRFLPEYRVRAGRAQLTRFIAATGGLQAGVLMLVALGLAWGAEALAARLGLADAVLLQLYAAVLATEGTARVLRDQMLGLLLAQRAAQVATVARGAVLVLLLLGAPLLAAPLTADSAGSALRFVAAAELAAAAAGLLLGAVALVRIVRRHVPDPVPAGTPAWQPPTWRRVAAIARDAYASMLLLIPAGGAVLTLTLGAIAGAPAAGAFGFVRGLTEQVRRFLPIELFLGLIRPGIVSRYAQHRDFAALNRQIALVFAVSVLAALPVLALLMAQAPLVARFIGGPTFAEAGPLLAVWSISLLLFTHRRALEVVANTAERSAACIVGSAVLACSPLAMAALLWAGAPVPVALAAPLLADLGFSGVVAWLLHRASLPYRLPGPTLARLLLLLAGASVVLFFSPRWLPTLWHQAVLAGVLSLMLTWGIAALWRPFQATEREAINALLPRPWFPF
jgi:O-antigen/teichoic acid export membrane protein